jgi:hypothetical protein
MLIGVSSSCEGTRQKITSCMGELEKASFLRAAEYVFHSSPCRTLVSRVSRSPQLLRFRGGGVGAQSRAVCRNELGHGRESGASGAVARG